MRPRGADQEVCHGAASRASRALACSSSSHARKRSASPGSPPPSAAARSVTAASSAARRLKLSSSPRSAAAASALRGDPDCSELGASSRRFSRRSTSLAACREPSHASPPGSTSAAPSSPTSGWKRPSVVMRSLGGAEGYASGKPTFGPIQRERERDRSRVSQTCDVANHDTVLCNRALSLRRDARRHRRRQERRPAVLRRPILSIRRLCPLLTAASMCCRYRSTARHAERHGISATAVASGGPWETPCPATSRTSNLNAPPS